MVDAGQHRRRVCQLISKLAGEIGVRARMSVRDARRFVFLFTGTATKVQVERG